MTATVQVFPDGVVIASLPASKLVVDDTADAIDLSKQGEKWSLMPAGEDFLNSDVTVTTDGPTEGWFQSNMTFGIRFDEEGDLDIPLLLSKPNYSRESVTDLRQNAGALDQQTPQYVLKIYQRSAAILLSRIGETGQLSPSPNSLDFQLAYIYLRSLNRLFYSVSLKPDKFSVTVVDWLQNALVQNSPAASSAARQLRAKDGDLRLLANSTKALQAVWYRSIFETVANSPAIPTKKKCIYYHKLQERLTHSDKTAPEIKDIYVNVISAVASCLFKELLTAPPSDDAIKGKAVQQIDIIRSFGTDDGGFSVEAITRAGELSDLVSKF